MFSWMNVEEFKTTFLGIQLRKISNKYPHTIQVGNPTPHLRGQDFVVVIVAYS